SKDDIQIDAYGTIDELNSSLGLLRDYCSIDSDKSFILDIQKDLFIIGSLLAIDYSKKNKADHIDFSKNKTISIESKIDEIDSSLPKMTNFIIPGGSLGKKLYLKVKDLIDTKNKPVIHTNANIGSVIVEMSEKMLGAVVVLDDSNKIMGIITDGDLRRQLVKSLNISEIKAKEIMTINPLVINSNTMAIDALKLMKSKKISHLIVEEDNRYHGIIHIQNIIKEGII
ncbi:CBS domain-containing protein, partial [Flavobacteriaceae bacterium]|nr:CBS domain-containing protein [Flavobacteriaceae bacterium]